MITLYSGTPGSGKSFHAAIDIKKRFKVGGGLICNFPIKRPTRTAKMLRVSYWDNSEITPQRLTAYAEKYHIIGVEGQTLLIVDEAQIIWNSRESLKASRADWIKFFTQHRKLGYNVLMIAQNDRMIDRQIRYLIENEFKHRKLNNYGFGGMILSILTGGKTWFVSIEYWAGGNKIKLSSEVFCYKKKVSDIYDSYYMFGDENGANSLYSRKNDSDPDLRMEIYGAHKQMEMDGSPAKRKDEEISIVADGAVGEDPYCN